jgi:cell division initiation protein
MSLTPLDVRKQQFRKVLRGLDPDEVRVFLSLVAGEMERQLQEHEALTEQVMAHRGKLEEYQMLERNLRDALVAAQSVREESRRQAERETELILARAELEAEGRLRASEVRLADLRREMGELKAERQNYLIRLRALIDTHMRMVEASEARFEAFDLGVTPAPGRVAEPRAGAPEAGPMAGPAGLRAGDEGPHAAVIQVRSDPGALEPPEPPESSVSTAEHAAETPGPRG